MVVSTLTAAPRGRPREFDIEAALDKAARVFSARGYHATSITDLTRAMGVAQGSLYKAFKDKKAVFIAVFDRFKAQRRTAFEALVAEGATGREQMRNALLFYAESSHGFEGRQGCLIIGCAVELSTSEADVADRVRFSMANDEAFLRLLIQRGQDDGSVAPSVPVEGVARALLCLMKGMRIVGKTGRTREEMVAAVDAALRMLD
ncbi:TetR/AcrR family transcriptional regulator [Elstera cyanobacteriorum]|uniref:TetR family transcriptional regulator n=1 Tax=Elstera cyanobacteriorum TaxID=2022747 RepID=A0A255XI60_9PROT|nr:TetR/AcrR family transcriptional regulator [Elstera cyanobacteriorum]OYQ16628.1 TetR family transcriptional regulator [Elstera cyanobacteriorum]